MHKAVTRYAKSGPSRIAYQVVGHGSLDLVFVPGFPSNLEIMWEDPGYSRLVKRLSGFCRLVLFDPRGTGLSDPLDPREPPTALARIADIGAVLDAAGCGRAAVLGTSDGAAQALLFAAAFPGRTRALILHGGRLRPDTTPGAARRLRAQVEAIETSWGMGALLPRLLPGRADDRSFAAWWGRLERLAASPTVAVALVETNAAIDAGPALADVAAPVLVLHPAQDSDADRRALAGTLANARVVDLPGRDLPVWMGDVDRVADVIEEFLTGERPVSRGDRVLAMLLMARVVGMARGGAGAAAGRHLEERLDLLREAVPRVMARHGGEASWPAADRIAVRFDGAARAVGGAIALRDAATALGLCAAQGIHAGEVDLAYPEHWGHALEVADRIAASTGQSEILLSRLASELVSGSGLQFADRGTIRIEGSAQPLAIVGLTSERHLEPLRRARQGGADPAILSPREREVLGLVADGLSNPHIAVQLGLSEHTVKRHVANILLKLEMPTRAAAASLMARQSR